MKRSRNGSAIDCRRFWDSQIVNARSGFKGEDLQPFPITEKKEVKRRRLEK
jgi:hypothetical protein